MLNKTVNVNFNVEEWYPIYEETNDTNCSYEDIGLTQYELFKVRRTLQEFKHVQTMIKKKIEEAGHEL